MILVFGGTTEGKKVATSLSRLGLSFVYSTKTVTDFIAPVGCTYRYGSFSEETLKEFCINNGITIVIHAAHPFALELAQTIEKVATRLQLEVIRFERTYSERVSHELVHYFKDYEQVIKFLHDKNPAPLLILTGVQTLSKLKDYWKRNLCYARILPRQSSLDLALKEGFSKENLILTMPSDTVVAERELIYKCGIKGILTKESGESGFLEIKIQAAIDCKIPIMIMEKTKSVFQTVTEEGALENLLSSLYYG